MRFPDGGTNLADARNVVPPPAECEAQNRQTHPNSRSTATVTVMDDRTDCTAVAQTQLLVIPREDGMKSRTRPAKESI